MNTDLIGILGNLSQSLYPVQHLISGGAYVLGLLFLIIAIAKLRKVTGYHAQERLYGPVVLLGIGAILLFLPTALTYFANTAFGPGSIISYGTVDRTNVLSTMVFLIRTAGLLWFVRGCVLLTHAGQPGAKTGSKGLAFLVAGILAMNIINTVSMLNSLIIYIVSFGKPG